MKLHFPLTILKIKQQNSVFLFIYSPRPPKCTDLNTSNTHEIVRLNGRPQLLISFPHPSHLSILLSVCEKDAQTAKGNVVFLVCLR